MEMEFHRLDRVTYRADVCHCGVDFCTFHVILFACKQTVYRRIRDWVQEKMSWG